MQLAHAPHGGENYVGRVFKGGEFLPFYIPRDRMPQIDEQDEGSLLEFLKQQSVGVNEKVVAPQLLRAHQRIDFNMAMAMDDKTLAKPALVSSDAFVLDGNHRWMAHAVRKLDMRVFELELTFDLAIAMLFKFPKTYCYGDGQFHPVRS